MPPQQRLFEIFNPSPQAGVCLRRGGGGGACLELLFGCILLEIGTWIYI